MQRREMLANECQRLSLLKWQHLYRVEQFDKAFYGILFLKWTGAKETNMSFEALTNSKHTVNVSVSLETVSVWTLQTGGMGIACCLWGLWFYFQNENDRSQ